MGPEQSTAAVHPPDFIKLPTEVHTCLSSKEARDAQGENSSAHLGPSPARCAHLQQHLQTDLDGCTEQAGSRAEPRFFRNTNSLFSYAKFMVSDAGAVRSSHGCSIFMSHLHQTNSSLQPSAEFCRALLCCSSPCPHFPGSRRSKF